MNARAAVTIGRLLVVGACVLGALFADDVVAEDKIATISVLVSSKGLDLSQPADTRTFYTRLKSAAWSVCTRGTPVDLLPVYDLKGCYEKALGDAVHDSNTPLLTRIYLETHTLREAAARRIGVPAQVAAK
jgi:UrcA family protein